MTTKRVGLVTVPSAPLLLGSAAFALKEPAWRRGEISVQGTAFLTKNSQGNVDQADLAVKLAGTSRINPYVLAERGV